LNRGFVSVGGALPDLNRGFVSADGALPDLNRCFVSAGGALLDLNRGFVSAGGASSGKDSDLIGAFDLLSPRVRRLFACGANSLYLCGV
jgi:hypothetical protein